MTIDEMFRRIVRAHLSLIAVCVLIPLVVLAYAQATQAPSWVAKVRIQVLSDAPTSSTQADALNSRVLALATTPGLVAQALADGHTSGDAQTIAASQVSAVRLGESSVVELEVRARSARAAGTLASALAARVTTFMNSGNRRLDDALSTIRDEIRQATARRDALTARLTRSVRALDRDNISVRLTTAQQTLDQLVNEESALAATDLQRDRVVVVDPGNPTVTPTPSSLIPRAALALILGLVLGLTLAVALETLHPRIAGIRVLARRLGAPVLGTTGDDLARLEGALTLAARRQGVETLVLVGVDERDERAVVRLLDELPPVLMATPHVNGVPVVLGTRRPQGVPAATGRGGAGKAGIGKAGVGGKAGNGAAVSLMTGEPGTEADRSRPPAHPRVRFTDLVHVRPQDETCAGTVVVSSGSALESRLVKLDDLVQTLRWPVVGILETVARHPSGVAR